MLKLPFQRILKPPRYDIFTKRKTSLWYGNDTIFKHVKDTIFSIFKECRKNKARHEYQHGLFMNG